jgi:tetratricopeptide (TPR) repeat protein
VGTVGWWATWPAERVLGFQVSDRVAYQLYGPESSGEGLKGRTYPEGLILSLAPEIRKGSLRAEEDLRALLGRDPDPANQDEQALRQILISTRTYHHSAIRLLREYAPQVAAVYYEGTDTVAHLFMRYAPPRLPGVPPEQVERWGSVVERYYLLQDRLLGELVAAVGEETVLMVVSDHGFKDGSTRPQSDPRIGVGVAADWHRRYGVLAVSGPGIRKGSTLSDVSVLDVTPTLLALLGLPAAGDMDGRAIEEPARVIATYEEEAGRDPASAIPDDPAAGAVEQEIIAKLTALGYLGQTTPNASNNVGITLLQQGRHAEAEQAFREAVTRDPGFLPARLNVARALMAGRDLEGALKELVAVRRADPDMAEVENLIGNILMEQDRVRGAEETFRSALTKDPRNLHLWNSRVVEMDGDYAEAINNIGLVYREQGLFDAAVAEFQSAARADPEFPGSYNNLGLTYQDAGDLDSALEAYDRGLQVDPENPVILNNHGSALLASGRLEEARRSFRKAVESDPEYASAHNNLGAALGMLGDLNGEFEEYLKAIDLEPDYADARLNLSLNLIRRGRPQEAARALRQVLDREPDHGRALLELGALLIQQGDEGEGILHLERAGAALPEWPAPRNALARLHLARGRHAEALKEARISLSLDPNQPEILHLAEAAGAAATSGSRP